MPPSTSGIVGTPGIGVVYLIVNKATGTAIDLSNGETANGTRIQGWTSHTRSTEFFNQLWLIDWVPSHGYYTVRNVRSNTYMDLSGGSIQYGTDVQGWVGNNSLAQRWWINGDDEEGYTFTNCGSRTVLDLETSGHAELNGAAIRGWGDHGGANQKWYLHRHSREPGAIDELLRINPDTGVDFKRYNSDVLYITLPYNIINLIWKNKGLGNRVWRPESYDSDDFAFAMKAAVGDWVYDNIRAPVAIAFGIMYGNDSQTNRAYNWYPNHDFSAIVIFEPMSGKKHKRSDYEAYFGIY